MPYLLKQNIHNALAHTFYNDVISRRNMYYYFLGRTHDWEPTTIPPAIPDTFSEESTIRNNIIFAKRINGTDIAYVVRRIDWVEGTVYDRYDGDLSTDNPSYSGATHVKDAKFYVLTEDMNVYKCIHNNANQPSTIKPVGSDYDVIRLADGYIWKFMYSIAPNLQYKFLTENYMPLSTALNQRYYDNQGIESVTINNGGAGYEGAPITSAVVVGDGINAAIRLSISPVDGRIANVHITNEGSGYTTGTIEIVSVDGKGTGKYDNHTSAILTPRFKNGKLIDVTINDPGMGYSTDIQTNIVVNGTGKGAELWPVVENGEIVDVIIENAGYGYSEVQLAIESVTGTGASLTVTTGMGDVDSVQADVELLAVAGAVYVVDMINLGVNYTYATVTIDGDGYGLQLTPIVYGGQVIRMQVDNIGQNYTWASITINGDGTGAECKALLSPLQGHGHNVVDELFANMVSIHSTVKFEKNQGVYTNNDYRQFGILRNPASIDSKTIYRNLNGSTCYLVTMESVTGISNDDRFYLKSEPLKKFLVVAVDTNTRQLLIQDFGGHALNQNDVLIAENGGTEYILNAVTYPELNKKTGELIFVDNRMAIYQTTDQFISLRTILKF